MRLLPALALLALVACGDDDLNDARLVLDRAGRLDVDAPATERRDAVTRLSGLALRPGPVQDARDICVQAHRTILEAERRTGEARAALDGYPSEDAIPTPERARIAGLLDESDAHIERSGPLFSECHRRLQELRRRVH